MGVKFKPLPLLRYGTRPVHCQIKFYHCYMSKDVAESIIKLSFLLLV